MASLWSSLSRAERADLSKDFNSLDTSLAETAILTRRRCRLAPPPNERPRSLARACVSGTVIIVKL